MKNNIFQTSSSKETQELGRTVAKILQPGDLIGLSGKLGAGKTTFVQGLAEGLHLKEGYLVSSPTFTWVHEYPCETLTLYHIDLYRMENPADIDSLDLPAYFEKGGISVIEWFEKARGILPKDMLEIKFEQIDLNRRKITLFSKTHDFLIFAETEVRRTYENGGKEKMR